MNGGGFNELLNQLEVFEKALRQVMDLPGNWHAGLSMLSSIVTLFYDSLLKPIADMVWCGSISTRKLTSVTIKRHVSYTSFTSSSSRLRGSATYRNAMAP
jgi:hypothetical protein